VRPPPGAPDGQYCSQSHHTQINHAAPSQIICTTTTTNHHTATHPELAVLDRISSKPREPHALDATLHLVIAYRSGSIMHPAYLGHASGSEGDAAGDAGLHHQQPGSGSVQVRWALLPYWEMRMVLKTSNTRDPVSRAPSQAILKRGQMRPSAMARVEPTALHEAQSPILRPLTHSLHRLGCPPLRQAGRCCGLTPCRLAHLRRASHAHHPGTLMCLRTRRSGVSTLAVMVVLVEEAHLLGMACRIIIISSSSSSSSASTSKFQSPR